MERHSFMLKKHSEKRANEKKAFEMWKARSEVDINANGTSGYVVKHGPNRGKVLAHKPTKSTNNWQRFTNFTNRKSCCVNYQRDLPS